MNLDNLESQVEAEYITSSGDKMKFRFPDQRSLNGEKVEFSDMPLFESPYLKGNDRVLKIQYENEELILDFNKDEIIKKVK